ncbi:MULTISPECIES: YIP1 family protein [unclassified Leptolyngbya]|uniref:YIP1 family protein n=1 Tax=unclassified Leptolyngbya TaxID=2650499 RepID=UPI0016832346|nr:YIP1 family protein [Leptolyngbya sp. FACHB-8]MBD2154921.1 YIP1 family protein [Leptolyngbya sp. FACHB-16]
MSKQSLQKHLWATLWNAIALKANLYDNARNTPRNHRIALTIVLLAALSHMLGSSVILLINRASGQAFFLALLIDGLSIISGYYLWTLVILKVGQWLKPIDPTYGDLLSPIGFAYAPQVFNFLTLIPLLGRPIELVLAAWSLLAAIVATREGLDIKTRQAALICILGWVPIQIAIGFIQLLEQEIANTF